MSANTSPGSSDWRMARLIEKLPIRLRDATHWLMRPSSRWYRLPAGAVLVVGGILSILPGLGIWMLPLGLFMLAEDVPPLGRLRSRALDWVERRRPHWLVQ